MEEVPHQKFSCKFCTQSFDTGISLGGHMRCHTNSIQSDEKHNTVKGFEAGKHSGYGLRKNPKKSSRVTVSKKITSSQEYFCKICGKGFPSSRAMSSHMTYHSETERGGNYCKECGRGFRSPKALYGHMRWHSELLRVDNQSDGQTAILPKRKKARTKRYCKINSDLFFSNSKASLVVTGIDQELEELAPMCLMMLSRDVRNWAGISSINNPIAEYEVGNLECNSNHILKIENPNSCYSDNVNLLFGKGDSEFGVSDEQKMVELEESVNGFLGIDSSDTELEKTIQDEVTMEPATVELGKGLRNGTGSETFKSNSRKKAKFDDCDPELKAISCVKMKCTTDDSKVFDDSHKAGKYKCKTCSKIFHSHQALGGHRSCHKTIATKCKLECTDNDSANLEVDGEAITSCHELKKSKVHQCLICFRDFASGRALGGHMGAHCVVNHETEKVKQVMEKHPVIGAICNLNLAATLEEEEVNGQVGFDTCLVRTGHNYQPLIGLVSS